MMPGSEVHLTDEELIAVRDGACRDPGPIVHVENCDYCQAVLEEWRWFQTKLTKSAPPSSMSMLDYGIDSLEEMDAPLVFHKKSVVDSYSRDTDSPKYEILSAPPTPPAALMETAQKLLNQFPVRKSLGALTLYITEDAELHLEADTATLSAAGEVVYAVGDCQLHLSTRQAGFATLLVVRLSGTWITEHASEYDITLVSTRGVVQVQPLLRDSILAQGMAWFSVPRGESELLIHLDETWQIQVRKVFPPKV